MHGRLAVTHYTDSIIRILSGTIPPKSNYHQSCPQTIYQFGNQHNLKGAESYKNKRRNNYQQKDYHNGGNRNRTNSAHYGYNVRVSNKFENLGKY